MQAGGIFFTDGHKKRAWWRLCCQEVLVVLLLQNSLWQMETVDSNSVNIGCIGFF